MQDNKLMRCDDVAATVAVKINTIRVKRMCVLWQSSNVEQQQAHHHHL